MGVTVIVGAQWGDEGKGKVTDYFARDARVVARYQGGNNAGHTVIAGGKEYKFHLLPSGVVSEDKVNLIANGVVVDPSVLLDEVATLEAAGVTPRLHVSDRAHVIMPYHKLLDGIRETASGEKAIGTTKRGIGPCYADKAARTGIRVADLVVAARLRERVAAVLPEKQAILAAYGSDEKLDLNAIVTSYAALGNRIRPLVADVAVLLEEAADRGDHVLLEGAQGTFLDLDHGTYPYVTSSNTTSGGACTGTGLPPTAIDEVVGIVKAYTTRVGAGPFPTELRYETEAGKHLTDEGHEFGTTTGRRRRVGWLDLVLLRRAARVNGFTGIALTKLDVLAGLPEIHVAEAYDIRGKRVEELPSNPESLALAKPVYTPLEGFSPFSKEDVAAASKGGLDALPDAARAYVEYVEAALDCPVVLVGLGPEREATIDRREEVW